MTYLRKEIIGEATLYLGDCLQVIPDIYPANHCITDPPFEAEAHTQQRRVKRGGVCETESLPFAAMENRSEVAAAICSKVTQGWILAFCQAEAVQAWRESLEAAGAKYKRAMVWVKPDGMPQYSGDMPSMGYESIVAAWHGFGKSKWNGGGRHGVFTFNKQESQGKSPHPTTKPQPLMRELVELFTHPGDVVLDPFMGSGSTGVACIKRGRQFVGIEIDEKYFDLSCRRIEEAYKQPDFFVQPTKPMKQEAMAL